MKCLLRKTAIGAALLLLLGSAGNAVAECQDLQTTEAIVNYVCDYKLVSNTQCRMWREDVRQMTNNTEVIVNSFISWNMESQNNSSLVTEN